MKRSAPLVAFALLLALLAAFALHTPKQGTWDILEYTAAAEAVHNNDFLHLHRYAYAQLQQHTSSANFADLTSASDYRRQSAADPVLFGTGLQFYAIRPLYVLALAAGMALGANPVLSAGVVAALAYWIIGLTVFLWLRAHSSTWFAFTAALLLMLTYPLLLVGRLYTPDALAACATTVAAYLIFERRTMLPGVSLLLASVWMRTDACIFVGFTLLFLAFADDERIRLPLAHALALIALTAASVLAINHFAGNYGFASLMHNQFVREADPPDAPYRLSLGLYLRALASPQGAPAALRGYTFAFLLLGAMAAIRRRTTLRDVGLIGALTAAAHFVIFPYFHDRLFAGEYILLALSALGTLSVALRRSAQDEDRAHPAPLEIASTRPSRPVAVSPRRA